MATWKQLKLQDASSPLMEELICFHDYTLMILVMIIMLVFYWMMSLIYGPLTKRLFLENQKLETTWTIMPAMMLMFMALPSLKMLYLMDEVKTPFMTMKAIGHQWYWSYEYTDYKKIEFDSYMMPTKELKKGQPRLLEVDKRLTLPTKNPMRMLITSADVLHSWTTPSLGMKMDAVPGRLNQTSFLMKRTGLFFGQCSEMCGAKHSFMPMVMEAVTFKVFEKWMTKNMEE